MPQFKSKPIPGGKADELVKDGLLKLDKKSFLNFLN